VMGNVPVSFCWAALTATAEEEEAAKKSAIAASMSMGERSS
jgi:hypothetical protein